MEENLRFLKGKETVMAKATKLGLEAQLKKLKEQQRQARPLPARLQAATDRVTTTQQLCDESEAKETAWAALKTARQEDEEAQEKKLAALQELEEDKKAAGAKKGSQRAC